MGSRPTPQNLAAAIEQAIGHRPRNISALGGGCIAEVRKIEFERHAPLVAKWAGAAAGPGGGLALEAAMLRHLEEHSRLPVPAVLYADDRLLLIEFIETAGRIDAAAETHAAELIAALHGMTGPSVGFGYDTLIGGLPQPNPPTASWRDFFRDHRLLHMAHAAHHAGRLPARLLARVDTLAGRLERWIAAQSTPSLLHGDLWAGNILVRAGRIAGFIDPAIYYGDAEIELAFATLFDSLSAPFFRRYGELRPLAPGFFEERRDLYNLYPLLVHVRLFGGGYVGQVERTLARFGC